MYYIIGMSMPSLQRESTDSLIQIMSLWFAIIRGVGKEGAGVYCLITCSCLILIIIIGTTTHPRTEPDKICMHILISDIT